MRHHFLNQKFLNNTDKVFINSFALSNKKTNLKWLHASNHLLEKFCYYGGKKALLIGSGLEFDFNFEIKLKFISLSPS